VPCVGRLGGRRVPRSPCQCKWWAGAQPPPRVVHAHDRPARTKREKGVTRPGMTGSNSGTMGKRGRAPAGTCSRMRAGSRTTATKQKRETGDNSAVLLPAWVHVSRKPARFGLQELVDILPRHAAPDSLTPHLRRFSFSSNR